MLRVLIVDDEQIARHRLRWLLEKEKNVEVAGECRDGRSVVSAVKEHPPNLVLLDIKMPDMDGSTSFKRSKPTRDQQLP